MAGTVSFPRDTTVNSIIVQSGGTLTADAAITVLTNMTVLSGGVVTHAVRDTAGLRLNVTGTLDVQSGGLIDVVGRGLLGGQSAGASGETYDGTDAIVAGAHGTSGGDITTIGYSEVLDVKSSLLKKKESAK